MAGKPIKLKGKYYSRIYIRIGKNNWKEKLIHLGTANKLEADSRMIFIREAESSIKLGKEVSFPWQNNKNRIEIKRYPIENAINDYLKFKASERLKKTTLDRIRIALYHFKNLLGCNYPVAKITIENIDVFKQYYSSVIRHSPNTLNNNLSKINALLIWLYDRNKIDSVPKIAKVKVNKKLPAYITDDEWNRIMNLDSVYRKHYGYYEKFDDHWKRAFYFYRETGCRLSEPFNGQLNGNWLIIEADNSKVNTTREIFIPDELIDILNEMQKRVTASDAKNKRDCIQSYSKKFRYACDTISITKYFHCLRDTYAVRRYLQTGDLYLVAKELGHSTVKMTEKYANFNIKRLEQDLPSIINSEKLRVFPQNHIESYTNHRIQLELQSTNIVGKG